jgi:hypothetical protein
MKALICVLFAALIVCAATVRGQSCQGIWLSEGPSGPGYAAIVVATHPVGCLTPTRVVILDGTEIRPFFTSGGNATEFTIHADAGSHSVTVADICPISFNCATIDVTIQ